METIKNDVEVASAKAGNNTADKTTGLDYSNMDLTVRPGDDFFRYATGNWIQNNPQPPIFPSWGSFVKLDDDNTKQIAELIQGIAAEQHEPGTVAQKIADLYNLMMDTERLNKEGFSAIQPFVDKINAISSREELLKMMATEHRNLLFGIGICPDEKNSNFYIIGVGQGGLSLGNRDYYLSDDPELVKVREAFKEHVVNVYKLTGATEEVAQAKMENLLKYETQIAEVSFSIEELRDPEKNYHKMSVAEASELCKFEWDTYFKNYGYDQTTEIDLGQPAPVAKACEILMTAPLEDLKSIFEWCRISGYCSYISDEFVEENFRFNQKLTGVQEQLPRWRRAVYLVDGLMDDAVGQMYVEKYFPAESKQRMLDLVHNLQTVLGERIKAQTWMSEATKQAALEKLGALRIKIGYPDKWEDISGLTVDPKLTLVENIYRIGKFYWNLRKEKRYNKPVDKDEWHVAAQTVNAFYSSTRNEICFPAGILQPPFFSKDFDDAVNYGAIGVVIGHEMTHGFDDQGRKFDKEGNLRQWWADADIEAFKASTDQMATYFNSLWVIPDELHCNGRLCLGENIADHGGLNISFQALQLARQQGSKTYMGDENGFTSEQRFFLSFANVWAGVCTVEILRLLTQNDEHPANFLRVNGGLAQCEEWYKAFDIKEGDKLYVAPSDRVNIW